MNPEREKEELCRILARIGALKFGVFRLTSGRVSPYYVDLRIVPSFPDAFKKICDLYLTLIKSELDIDSFDRISSIPTAGVLFASIVAYHLKKPLLYTRPHNRLHGRERRVEGIIMPGDCVLLLDDLLTTGKSAINTSESINAEGGIVEEMVVMLDREEGGREKLAKANIKLHSLLKMSEAAEKLCEMDYITEEQKNTILRQMNRKK